MFLKTIGDARLLPTQGDLYVLRDAPSNTCLQFSKTMVDYLSCDIRNEEITLLTKEHVEWVMQIIGRTFSLPIDIQTGSADVIANAIDLYKKWMHLPTAPVPIQQHSQYFTKKMCCHLSLVFQHRNEIQPNSQEFQVHVTLCQRVLAIYSKSARAPPHEISETDWNQFLCRIFLGICDEVMRGPADSRSLGNEIEQDVFFCMFDIWLRSKMQNEQLWTTLISMASKEWIHRRWFIESWGQCCSALTRRLIYMLYGGNNGSNAVFVFWPVLGTKVISINAMLEGRGSVMASSGGGKFLPKAYLNNSANNALSHNHTNTNHMDTNGYGYGMDHKNYNQNSDSHSMSSPMSPQQQQQHSHPSHTQYDTKALPRLPAHNSSGRRGSIENNHHNDINTKMNMDYHQHPHQPQSSHSNTHSGGGGGVSAQLLQQQIQSNYSAMTYHSSAATMATYINIDDARLLIFLWNCMLNVLDINAMNDPKCFGCAIAWISRMVDMFLKVHVSCGQRASGILPPDGNSILKIFSKQLFTAAVNMNGFSDARSIALGALCRIFISKPYTKYEAQYLLNFYHTLHETLKDPQNILESAREQVILNGATLFACDFDGCRALISIFLPHLRIILNKTNKPRLRLAAITMLSSFISLEWHFWPNSTAAKKSNHKQVPKLQKNLKQIRNILYDAIQSETNEYNLQKLLWCCCIYLELCAHHISKLRTFPSDLVRTIWKHISEEAGHWPCHVITTAFKALSMVVKYASVLKYEKKNTMVNERLFVEMCEYAQLHLYLRSGNQFDLDSRRVLSVACMNCILVWLQNDPTLVNNRVLSVHIQSTIREAIMIDNNHHSSHVMNRFSFAASQSGVIDMNTSSQKDASSSVSSSSSSSKRPGSPLTAANSRGGGGGSGGGTHNSGVNPSAVWETAMSDSLGGGHGHGHGHGGHHLLKNNGKKPKSPSSRKRPNSMMMTVTTGAAATTSVASTTTTGTTTTTALLSGGGGGSGDPRGHSHSYNNSRSVGVNARNEVSTAILSVHNSAAQLARFFLNDVGSYRQHTHTPIHRFSATYLNEVQIEDWIWKRLHSRSASGKWQAHDRIRYFVYKKSRILTLIEMPRFRKKKKKKKTKAKKKESASTTKVVLTKVVPSKAGTTNVNNKSKPGANSSLMLNSLLFHAKSKSVETTLDYAHNNPNASNNGINVQLQSITKSTSSPRMDSMNGKNVNGSRMSAHDLSQHTDDVSEEEFCDVIILIRDAYGKYAWETTCVYNDHDKDAQIADFIAKNAKHIKDNSVAANGHRDRHSSSGSHNHRGSKLGMNSDVAENTRDEFARSIQKYQTLAQQMKFRCESDAALKYPTIVENESQSNSAYWSSEYIASNWKFKEAKNENTLGMQKVILTQNSIETPICLLHQKNMKHPLQNAQYRNLAVMNDSTNSINHIAIESNDELAANANANDSNSNNNNNNNNGMDNNDINNPKISVTLDHSNLAHKYSEFDGVLSASMPGQAPITDDAATFMHSRRLLSTLGFLRYDSSSRSSYSSCGIKNLEILDHTNGALTDALTELDSIPLLDTIACSIVFHDSGFISNQNSNGGGVIESNSEPLPLNRSRNNGGRNNTDGGAASASAAADVIQSRSYQLSDFDMLRNASSIHSAGFKHFLSKIGNNVDVNTHVGYTGGLTSRDCPSFAYYSNSKLEMSFICPSLLQTNYARKKQLYLQTCIRIIWSSSVQPFWLSTKISPTQRHPSVDTPVVYIRIVEQSTGLYRISIHAETVLPHLQGRKKSTRTSSSTSMGTGGGAQTQMDGGGGGSASSEAVSEQIFSSVGDQNVVHKGSAIPTTGFDPCIIGPLIDGMVVSESVLPQLIRKTVINTSAFISEIMQDSLLMNVHQTRERLISDICGTFSQFNNHERARNNSHREQFFQYFFMDPLLLSDHNQSQSQSQSQQKLKLKQKNVHMQHMQQQVPHQHHHNHHTRKHKHSQKQAQQQQHSSPRNHSRKQQHMKSGQNQKQQSPNSNNASARKFRKSSPNVGKKHHQKHHR